MQELKKGGVIGVYAVGAIFAYIILNQGGYFAGGIVSAGLIISLLILRTRVQMKVTELIFFAFSLWYFFCSVRMGFDIQHTAKGILPMVCVMFRLLLPEDEKTVQKLCEAVIKVAFYITVIAILICIYSSVAAIRLRRLTFPFQYANVSGIFFGVMFILSRYSGFEWARKRQYVFLMALALTQSVGAVGVTVITEIVMSRSLKRTLAILAIIVIGAVVLKSRVYQSMGTFIERFLQIHDGLVCMTDNYIFGIGAGRWGLAKALYQSGFYEAREIHGSIAQIGVDSGAVGLGLFIAALVFAFKCIRFSNKAYLAGIIMILAHSLLDFAFAFTAMGILMMLLFACGKDTSARVCEIKALPRMAVAGVAIIGLVIMAAGISQVKKLDGIAARQDYPECIKYYEAHPLTHQTVAAKEDYAKALYATGDKENCLTTIENIDVLSPDMIVLKRGCCGDWREVLKYLEVQRYNRVVYRTVFYKSNNEELQDKTKEMLDEAIDSMSFFGEILYNFKGEKIL